MKTLSLILFSVAASGMWSWGAARTLLMVDDHDVLYRSGTRRVVQQPVRHARNPVITEDKPWEMAIGWTSVYRDPKTGKYQVWYQAYSGSRAQQKINECVVCYAESPDGIVFTKPSLGLFEFNGDKNTNIVLIGNGVWGSHYCNSVVFDPRDKDASKRYKMAHYDWAVATDGKPWSGLNVAFSPDGIHWTKHPEAPITKVFYGAKKKQPPFVGEDPYHEMTLPNGQKRLEMLLPATMSDGADVIYDPKCKAFVLYGKMWFGGPDGGLGWKHGMGRSESKDFLHWSKAQLVCTADDADGTNEFHTSPVFLHHDRYFSLNQILNRAGGGTMDIELMISRDGREWERPFRSPYFIARSTGQDFDSGTILTNSNMIVHGSEMRFYYGAYSSGAIGGGKDITSDQQQSGVGFVSLPMDRFAGVRSNPEPPTGKGRPPADIGQITMKPVDLKGHKDIEINANAAGGSVQVELLNEDGYRVPGFDKDNCVPMKKDAVRQRVVWKDHHLADLPPGQYHIRVHLQQSTLFAIALK